MIKNPPIIKRVAKEMGGAIKEIIPERGYFLIKLKGKEIFVLRKFQIASDFISGKALTAYKDLTYVSLKENNIPMPKTVCFYKKTLNKKDLVKKLESLSYPIVIKDANGSNSKGVFTNIETLNEAKKIILKEIKKFPFLVAQEMIFGKEYRVLILGKKVLGVLEMIPPRIFGDGKSTVKELIEKKQYKNKKKTIINQSLKKILAEQSVSLKSVIKKNQEVFIKKNSCLAEGGEIKDATDLINPASKIICEKAAKATGKLLAGIDIICEDISKDPTKQTFSILEVNGKPDLYIHYKPNHGKTRNVIKEIIEFILKIKK